ncbi:LIM/homeobox protein Lhx9-like [Physella acuta]|nr:LIM/homeobox protein Lhx9-like [Physella acuta]
MNTMGKMGAQLRHTGHLLAEDDIKDEYHFSGFGLIQDRNCIDHHRRPMPPLASADPDIPGFCAGCGGRILDRYYLHAVEKQWHTHCLTCSDCHFRLDTELTCFARDGNIYCKTDYYRRFAVKNCARCQMPISANELIMRAKDQVFHLTCFACTACNRTLKSGEQYGLKDNLIYCRMDYELMFQGEFNLPSMSPGMGPHGAHSPGGGPPIPFYNGVGAVQKGRPRKRKSPMSDGDGCSPSIEIIPPPLHIAGLDNPDRGGDVLERDGYPHQTPRQKRVRTSFKHHQLRTMKSYFALNHNPDAKDLKQLAQKTGLSKRVLQVWFQNARAKYRRNLLKQQDSEGGTKAGQGQVPESPDGRDKEMKDSNSITDMNAGSPALSDISSTPSLSDIQSSTIETDHNSSSNTSISDLFSSTIATIN